MFVGNQQAGELTEPGFGSLFELPTQSAAILVAPSLGPLTVEDDRTSASSLQLIAMLVGMIRTVSYGAYSFPVRCTLGSGMRNSWSVAFAKHDLRGDTLIPR